MELLQKQLLSLFEQSPGFFPVSSDWGIVEEIVARAPKIEEPQPQVGSVSTSLFDKGDVLSDGKTNPGVTKAFKFSIAAQSLAAGSIVNDIGISFPLTTETVGLVLGASHDQLRVREKYNPGQTKWFPRTEAFVINGVNFDQNINLAAVYDQTGTIRRWLIQNGTSPEKKFNIPSEFDTQEFAKKM
jgi:hypothetical protein